MYSCVGNQAFYQTQNQEYDLINDYSPLRPGHTQLIGKHAQTRTGEVLMLTLFIHSTCNKFWGYFTHACITDWHACISICNWMPVKRIKIKFYGWVNNLLDEWFLLENSHFLKGKINVFLMRIGWFSKESVQYSPTQQSRVSQYNYYAWDCMYIPKLLLHEEKTQYTMS